MMLSIPFFYQFNKICIVITAWLWVFLSNLSIPDIPLEYLLDLFGYVNCIESLLIRLTKKDENLFVDHQFISY